MKHGYGIAIIGAGFIVGECHLPAYRDCRFHVVGIFSRSIDKARALAERFAVPNVYSSMDELLADPRVDVVDIAVPPHEQLTLIRKVAEAGKSILAQKPLAVSYEEAVEIVRICEKAGVKLCVNQNGRYDPAIQAAKRYIDQGLLGKPVFATIELRFKPHWQPYQIEYERLMFLFMSIHHLDQFRFWFGMPERIYASSAPHPDGSFKGDYLGSYILNYENGLLANAWDDGYTWNEDGFGVFYKIEGTDGVIKMNIGWPSGGPSEISVFSSKLGGEWHTPELKGNWFPDAFGYTMGELFISIETGEESPISGWNNLLTMAMVEACYKSDKEKRSVRLAEIMDGEKSFV